MRSLRMTMLTAAISVASVACGSGGEATTTEPPAASTTSAPATSTTVPDTTTTSSDTGNGVSSLPSSGGSLAPGTYRVAEFAPPATFTVGDGWESISPALDVYIGLARFAGFDEEFFPLISISGIPDETLDYSASPGEAIERPDDYAAWLAASPYFTNVETEETTIGGYPATTVTAELVAPPDRPDEMQFTLGFLAGQPLYYPVGETVRVHVVDIDGTPLLVTIEGATADWDRVLEASEPVLESLSFG